MQKAKNDIWIRFVVVYGLLMVLTLINKLAQF